MPTVKLDRRRFVRTALGVLPLPLFEFCRPSDKAWGVDTPSKPATGIPTRLAFTEHSFGVWPETWFPKTPGFDYVTSEAFEPMQKHRSHFSIIGGTENIRARGEGHNAVMEIFYACSYRDPDPTKTQAYGTTADQIAAKHIGRDTRFPAMVLGSYTRPLYGTLTCTLSKNEDGIPVPAIASPMEVYARLFGARGTFEQIKEQLARRRSLLDSSREELTWVGSRLGSADQQRLQQFETSLRQIELELEREAEWSKRPKPKAPLAAPAVDPLVESNATAHVRLMFDLLVAAWQTDSSRVASFHLPTLHILGEIGARVGRHAQNHQSASGNQLNIEMETKTGRWVQEQFAYLIDKLLEAKEADGSPLLNHSLIVGGSSFERAGNHVTKNLPVFVIGHGGGRMRHGQFAKYPEGTPLANVHLTVMQQAGVAIEKFGNSTGALNELLVG